MHVFGLWEEKGGVLTDTGCSETLQNHGCTIPDPVPTDYCASELGRSIELKTCIFFFLDDLEHLQGLLLQSG